MSTIDAFRPIATCTDADLRKGVDQGLWIAHALFVALTKIDDTEGEQGALAYLGAALVIAVSGQQEELNARSSRAGA